ncbi:NERD domain-containing protein [Burkholderia cenocepacia]|uniref:nuclease-related domain-containing protein n=1 Tax=Burkholderia cepacia complex TaxID=87882 RepID=UPI000F57B0DD|nr:MULTISPECIES: nuclease-related domain-containing protein [Burkholderia cepacia complex]ELW9449849.1 NERD domain-containing protein [Burkholderia cenocepacia]MBR8486010.1 NERD domain-containing protein [Burkholderia cenocepacia]MDN7471490.1 nuclease-related domain-containing protein [Burkholderia orbicola]MDN7501173.1 nuclease-related domain-containing protein [Burkholderia orbicola]
MSDASHPCQLVILRGNLVGEFSDFVRRGKIAGPNRPEFRREDWEKQKNSASLDDADKRILLAGLALDDLLTSVRNRIRLNDIDLLPDVLIRITIGLVTYNLFAIREHSHTLIDEFSIDRQFKSTSILQDTIKNIDGQNFSPDEMLTGCGDGIKYMLRQLVRATPSDALRKECHIIQDDLTKVTDEINNAILYHSATEIWNDCLANEYHAKLETNHLEIRPLNADLEIARAVSMYRRENMELRDFIGFSEIWHFKWSRSEKESRCEIPLVVKIYGTQRIERIDLGFNEKSLNAAATGIFAMLSMRHGHYKSFLGESLPKLEHTSLNMMIQGWRILQSLAAAILNSSKSVTSENASDILRLSPKIPKILLRKTLGKALSIDEFHAQRLIDAFVFTGDNSQDLWLQPLICVGQDYCLIIPCIYSTKLERVVEGWMRQGGLDLERRGPQFEKYCRNELEFRANKSPISSAIQVIPHEVKISDSNGNIEKIDIIVVIDNTVLLVEAKCILWPDDALRLANYRDTIKNATAQIKRQKHAVLSNYSEFSRRLKELNCHAPEEATVVCCVITNSAVYAGFPIDDIPVVDLAILARYFDNRYVKIERRSDEENVSESAIHFYSNAKQAGQNVQAYLSTPPQLADMKEYVKTREVFLPMYSQSPKTLIYHTYSVDVDVDAMAEKYKFSTVPSQ